jgi:hypothetical protein
MMMHVQTAQQIIYFELVVIMDEKTGMRPKGARLLELTSSLSLWIPQMVKVHTCILIERRLNGTHMQVTSWQ